MNALPALAAALMTASVAQAEAPGRPPGTPVEDLRVLMVSAIDSPDGRAKGVLVGQTAAFITGRFNASGPIVVEVSTERRFRQPGCSRLRLDFSQDGVNLPGAAGPERRTLGVGLNYCRDGMPPRSLD